MFSMLFLILFALLPAYCAAAGIYIPLISGSTGVPGQFIISLKTGSTSAQVQEVINVVGISKVLSTYNIGPDWHAIAIKDVVGAQVAPLLQQVLQLASYEYVADDKSGQNTCVYTIDTGCKSDHEQLRNAWYQSYTCNSTVASECQQVSAANAPTQDGNGHGTFVSAQVIGHEPDPGEPNFGMLDGGATLICIKVLSDAGSGALSDVAKGVELAFNHAKSDPKCNLFKINGANLSLGGPGPANGVLNDAITAAAQDANNPLFVAVAAGNDNTDANGISPANTKAACTVGALDEDNTKSSFSDFGSVVDVFAPGRNVLSAFSNDTQGQTIYSGTSMASPLVLATGLYLNELCPRLGKGPKKSPQALCAYVAQSGVGFTYKAPVYAKVVQLLIDPLCSIVLGAPCTSVNLVQVGTKDYTSSRAFNGGNDPCNGW
ncbi:subtilisin-like protein [Venturia nashicola]|nr:subtilisin-like protein [Venturia nashicola]